MYSESVVVCLIMKHLQIYKNIDHQKKIAVYFLIPLHTYFIVAIF